MTSSEKFSLKLNDFQDNISTAFSNLRNDTSFSDVTLVSEDGQKIEAHKVIISASSPFFMNILNLNKHPQPMIYLKGFNAKQLNSILNFIYHGAADICQDDLEDFLAIAEELNLKGLTSKIEENAENKNEQHNKKENGAVKNTVKLKEDTHLQTIKNYYEAETSTTQEYYQNAITTFGTTDSSQHRVSYSGSTYEDLKKTLWSMISRNGSILTCTVCGKTLDRTLDKSATTHMKKHVESLHVDGVSYACKRCGEIVRSKMLCINTRSKSIKKTITSFVFRSKNALGIHKTRYHK